MEDSNQVDTILVQLSDAQPSALTMFNVCAAIKKIPGGLLDGKTTRPWRLLNVECLPADSFLLRVVKHLAAVERLGYIEIWASGAGKDLELEIHMPRLQATAHVCPRQRSLRLSGGRGR